MLVPATAPAERAGSKPLHFFALSYGSAAMLRREPEPLELFVRQRSKGLNFPIRKFAPRFAPARSDPALRRHFAVQS